MSQKKNSGRDFTIDLGDDDDDIDWGSEDDFDNMEDVHKFSLADLFERDELKRRDRLRREREEARRAQTQNLCNRHRHQDRWRIDGHYFSFVTFPDAHN